MTINYHSFLELLNSLWHMVWSGIEGEIEGTGGCVNYHSFLELLTSSSFLVQGPEFQ